jgi:hypothetical protein
MNMDSRQLVAHRIIIIYLTFLANLLPLTPFNVFIGQGFSSDLTLIPFSIETTFLWGMSQILLSVHTIYTLIFKYIV